MSEQNTHADVIEEDDNEEEPVTSRPGGMKIGGRVSTPGQQAFPTDPDYVKRMSNIADVASIATGVGPGRIKAATTLGKIAFKYGAPSQAQGAELNEEIVGRNTRQALNNIDVEKAARIATGSNSSNDRPGVATPRDMQNPTADERINRVLSSPDAKGQADFDQHTQNARTAVSKGLSPRYMPDDPNFEKRAAAAGQMDEARINIVKARVRGGKIQRRVKTSNVAGMTMRGGQLTRMSAAERRRRKLGAKRAARKTKMKRTQMLRKRKMSLMKRQRLGI